MPRFVSNPQKARINLAKHQVSFEEAETIWQGPTLTGIDDFHSDEDEIRFTTFGVVAGTRKVLRVTHNEDGEMIRIIPARAASKREIEKYYAKTSNLDKK